MPQRGRPPQPGTAEEKAALRREKVRLYVKAHRERKKAAEHAALVASSESQQSESSSESSEHTREEKPVYSSKQCQDSSDELDIRSRQLMVVAKPHSKQHATRFSTAASPRSNNALGFALLGAFRGQFLPRSIRVPDRQEFGSELVTPCSAWVTHAYNIAVEQDSSSLKSSLMAVGLVLTSMQTQDQRLRMTSLDVYRKALRQVRNDIKPLTLGRTSNYLATYLSCLAAMMFELLHEGFSDDIMSHIKGAVTLMALLPRDANVTHLLNDLLLEDLCMWEIVFALKYRYPSPLRAIRRQKGVRNYSVDGDQQASSRNATTLGDLLDCSDELSTIMATVDQIKKTVYDNAVDRFNNLQVEIVKLNRALKALDSWESSFRDRFEPIFTQVGTDEATQDPIMQFSSYEISAPWVYYLTFRICAVETKIEALSELIPVSTQDAFVPPGNQDLSSHKLVIDEVDTSDPHPVLVSRSRSRGTANAKPASADDKLPLQRSTSTVFSQLQEMRGSLRETTTQLVEALCLFLPIPKGFIGASLVLFPLDRAKAMLKREIARLQSDLTQIKPPSTEVSDRIMADLNNMFQSMTVYQSLEQALVQFGMPPMPDD